MGASGGSETRTGTVEEDVVVLVVAVVVFVVVVDVVVVLCEETTFRSDGCCGVVRRGMKKL